MTDLSSFVIEFLRDFLIFNIRMASFLLYIVFVCCFILDANLFCCLIVSFLYFQIKGRQNKIVSTLLAHRHIQLDR